MRIATFSGHSVSNMGNAAQYALQDYDKFIAKHESWIVERISTAIHVEPAEENYNYWYVLTVEFIVPVSIGKGA